MGAYGSRCAASFAAFALCCAAFGTPAAEEAAPDAKAVAAEYEKIKDEIRAASQMKTSSKAEFVKFQDLVKERLGAFATKYPTTPEGFDAAFGLGALLARTSDPAAKGWLETAIKNAPPNANPRLLLTAHTSLANLLASSGDMDGARKALEEVRKISPDAAKDLEPALAVANRIRIGGTPFDIEDKDIDGKPVSLAKLKGSVVLIDFWATWCAPCRQELPNVKKVYAENKDKGFAILGISLDQKEDALRSFVKENDMPWPQVSEFKGWESRLAKEWNIRSIPFTVLLDRKGVIRYTNVRGEDLAPSVEKLVAEPKE